MGFLHIPKQEGINKIFSGNILIAEPFLADNHFSRSVVLVCEHGEDGTVGFIINRVTEVNLSDLMPEIDISIKIHEGGPVQRETLHILHRLPVQLGGIEIMPHLYWGGSFDVLLDLLQNNSIDEKDVKLFAGYAGWSVGQLENEMRGGAWYIGNMSVQLLFDANASDIWKTGVRSLGKGFEHLEHMPVNPQLN